MSDVQPQLQAARRDLSLPVQQDHQTEKLRQPQPAPPPSNDAVRTPPRPLPRREEANKRPADPSEQSAVPSTQDPSPGGPSSSSLFGTMDESPSIRVRMEDTKDRVRYLKEKQIHHLLEQMCEAVLETKPEDGVFGFLISFLERKEAEADPQPLNRCLEFSSASSNPELDELEDDIPNCSVLTLAETSTMAESKSRSHPTAKMGGKSAVVRKQPSLLGSRKSSANRLRSGIGSPPPPPPAPAPTSTSSSAPHRTPKLWWGRDPTTPTASSSGVALASPTNGASPSTLTSSKAKGVPPSATERTVKTHNVTTAASKPTVDSSSSAPSSTRKGNRAVPAPPSQRSSQRGGSAPRATPAPMPTDDASLLTSGGAVVQPPAAAVEVGSKVAGTSSGIEAADPPNGSDRTEIDHALPMPRERYDEPLFPTTAVDPLGYASAYSAFADLNVALSFGM